MSDTHNYQLEPDTQHIRLHLNSLFRADVAHHHPDAMIEIAHSDPDSRRVGKARLFSIFDIDGAVNYALEVNSVYGQNVYVGAAMRKPGTTPFARTDDSDFYAAPALWVDLDNEAAVTAARDKINAVGLRPSFFIRTGTVPEKRIHLYFALKEPLADADRLRDALKSLVGSFEGADQAITNPSRIMRLAGTISYPDEKKAGRGYVPEVTTFNAAGDDCYDIEQIERVFGGGEYKAKDRANSLNLYQQGRSDDALMDLIEGMGPGTWHNNCIRAISTMVGRGYTDAVIQKLIGPKCDRGETDPDLLQRIASARTKFNTPPRMSAEEEARHNLKGELILTTPEFLGQFSPPAYLIDGVIQRGYTYALTARTGTGKTAITLYLAQAIARNQEIGGLSVNQGNVLVLAGENPDDVRARFIVMCDKLKINPDSLPVFFINGVIDIAALRGKIEEEVAKIGEVTLVIVDTVAAYFKGDDLNSNTQVGQFAELLRSLTFLPGQPTVIANAHPVKNASSENLVPLGGGAFLNAIDGNLTLAGDGEQVKLHWQGKFRGPEFAPLFFKLETVTSDMVKDRQGRLMPSVMAQPVTESEAEQIRQQGLRKQDTVLVKLRLMPATEAWTYQTLAEKCRWQRLATNGRYEPDKQGVHRALLALERDKLVKKGRAGKYVLTDAGYEVADKIRRLMPDDDE